jgi:hypothetical protein
MVKDTSQDNKGDDMWHLRRSQAAQRVCSRRRTTWTGRWSA